MSQQGRDFSSDGFVSGMGLSSKASARMSPSGMASSGMASSGMAPSIPSKSMAKSIAKSIAKAKSHSPFVPLHDLSQPAAIGVDKFKKLENGRVAIANIENNSFEPGWGSETKPRSQREEFLSEQAFADGKLAGELEARKLALEEGHSAGREIGYKEGFAAGSKEREGEVARLAQEIATKHNDDRVEKIASFLGQMMEVEKDAAKRRDTELMTLMIAIFEKTLPALAEGNGEQEVRFFLDSILRRFENIPQITITLAEQSQDLVSRLRTQVGVLLSSDKSIDTMVSFRFASDFGLSDCRIAWAEGEVERRFDELWGEVRYALERHLPKKQNDNKRQEKGQEGKQEVVSSSQASPNEVAGASGSLEESREQASQQVNPSLSKPGLSNLGLSKVEASAVMQDGTDER